MISLRLSSIFTFITLFALSSAFAPQSSNIIHTKNPVQTLGSKDSTTKLFFFGQPKDDGSPGDYVCKDCGYVFTKGPAAWAKLDDKYKCPPCGAPKFRFKKVPKGSVKDTSGAVAAPKKKGGFFG